MHSSVEKVLSELELREAKAITGSVHPETGQTEKRSWNVPRSTGEFLNAIALFWNAKNVLEIGTSNGYSGIWLSEALSHNGGKLYTVESHSKRFGLARENFLRAGLLDFVEMIKGHAPEAFEGFGEGVDECVGVDGREGEGVDGLRAGEISKSIKWPSSFDLVFIDATKMEYLSYLDAILPMLRVGGLIIADNCLTHFEDLEEFINSVNKRDGLKSHLLHMDNGLMLSVKVAGA